MRKKPQIAVNVPEEVAIWLRKLEVTADRSKSNTFLAGVCALRLLSDAARTEAYQWATLLQEGNVTWAELEDASTRTEKQRAQALQRMVQAAILGTPEAQPKGGKDAHRKTSASGG